MTRDSDFKKIVRRRMAKTGEGYTTARRQLEATPPAGSLRGWSVTGPGDGLEDYEGGLDSTVRHEGRPCAYLRSVKPDAAKRAVVMQSILTERYRGKRVRLTAWVRSVKPNAGLWMRIVPYDRDQTFAYGRHLAQPEWTRGAVVLDVPVEAHRIMFGLFLEGAGQAWISQAQFEVVDTTVPVSGSNRDDPREPVNLTFED